MWDRYPYTKGINLVHVAMYIPKDRFRFEDVFDPEFLVRLEEEIQSIVEPQKDNQNLIGYFWSDMPAWKRTRDGQGWISSYKSLPEDSAGGRVWKAWREENAGASDSDFLAVIAKQLYSKAYEFIRLYDKNHLIFSDRYCDEDMPEHVVREALPFVDAIAIHPWIKRFDPAYFDEIYEKYGLPIYMADHGVALKTKEHPKTEQGSQPSPQAYSEVYGD